MSKFLHPKYQSLSCYVPGEQPRDKAYIKLNTNESPYPPSPEVIAAVDANAVADLRLYSDPEGKCLRQKLADRYRVAPENIYLANGSDDILSFAFMAYASDGEPVAFADITYGFYSVFAALYGSDAKILPLREDFSIDYRDYLGIDRTIFLANPNAPTGLALSVENIEKILESNPGRVVIIDEAYVDFGAESCLPLVHRYDNLLIVRTFSKSRSMAGARLGFAIASRGIIEDLNRIKFSTNPYNVNRLTLLAGAAAIDSDHYFIENCERIMKTRTKTEAALSALGFEVIPSKANFIFAKHNAMSGEAIYQALKERGILVRHFSSPRITEYNRITVGSEEEMASLLATLADILASS
ncbi:MAG: histidinol-phosphate transaminase [Ruminococcaceae bacterium]|nr:histidinol-phosphate transaminase [Oscillospiraceae bacterium]